MHSNQIYYRFKSETKEETMTFEETEITAADLRQRIRLAKFGTKIIGNRIIIGNAPEKFELALKDMNTKRDYSDTEYIKPKTTVLVYRMPGHKPLSGGVYVQPTEDLVEESKNVDNDKTAATGEKAKNPQEERSDALLLKYNVTPGHRLYPFLKNSRFFIIKCSNEKNLETSQRNEEWATTTYNQSKLDAAYQACSNVILFFSVNKSAHFQGMTKMVSGLTGKISREWQSEGVKLGASFKVKWIVTSKMPFSKISNLKNPLCNEPIRKARDTTEISEEIGIQIALYIDEFRTPGGIDLPAAIASIPNFDIAKLSNTLEQNVQAQKVVKPEEKSETFDLFDDLSKKEESKAEPAAADSEPEPMKIQEAKVETTANVPGAINNGTTANNGKKDEVKKDETIAIENAKAGELKEAPVMPAEVHQNALNTQASSMVMKPPWMGSYNPWAGMNGMPGMGMGGMVDMRGMSNTGGWPNGPYGPIMINDGSGRLPSSSRRSRHHSHHKSHSRSRSRSHSRSRSKHHSRDKDKSKSRKYDDSHRHRSRRNK